MRLTLAFLVALTAACSAAGRVETSGPGGATGSGTGTGMGGAPATTTGTGGGGGTIAVGSSSSSGLFDAGGDADIVCGNMLDLTGCPCGTQGETRPCYTGPKGTEGVGLCHAGTQTCDAEGEIAQWSACSGDVVPQPEVCSDTLDHDCNGLVGCADPSCVGLAGCCTAGTTRACYTGPNGTEGVGPCHAGTQLCGANGAYGACMGEALPGTEIGNCADGIDNDCDGLTDCLDFVCWLDPHCLPKTCTPNATQPCYTGPSGTEGVGPCHGGTQTCAADGESWGACTGQALPTSEGDHCTDGIDNDCNGHVDCADPACATATSCCTVDSNPPDGTIWANSPDTLYRIDPTTFAVTTVGILGVADQMTDVAVATSGQLYGISFTALYKINESTGAASLIADVPGTGNNSLTFLPNGTLLASDSSGDVKIVNPTTGQTTAVGNYGSSLVSAGDLVAVRSGIMYGTSSTTAGGGDASANNVLLRVNVSTGEATAVGPIGFGDVWGLAYSGARVIGFTTEGQIVRIDPQTGAGALLSDPGFMFWGAGQSPLVDDNACP